MLKALRIEQGDNVAVLLDRAEKDAECVVNGEDVVFARDEIPFGHKIALTDIPQDGSVIKYGEIIGYATQPIRTGDWVHTHNLKSDRGRSAPEGLS